MSIGSGSDVTDEASTTDGTRLTPSAEESETDEASGGPVGAGDEVQPSSDKGVRKEGTQWKGLWVDVVV